MHRHIYLSEGVRSADSKAYLDRLCHDLSAVLQSDKRGVVAVRAIAAEIPTKQIIALGLIVNELVTNAVKHGAGKIVVSFERTGLEYSLSVCDEGAGLPADFDPRAASGLGMRVTSTLVHQLEGRLLIGKAEGSRGAKLTILFADQSETN